MAQAVLSVLMPPSSTPYYSITQFGIHAYETSASYPAYFYPTVNEPHDAGIFLVAAHGSAVGDFNGDGRQDIVVNWVVFPHTVERSFFVQPTVFLNDGSGHLSPANINVPGGYMNFHMSYRPVVEDFNGDGIDDFAQAGQGLIKRNPDGTYENDHDPIQLVLSQPDGTMVDATANITGQENGGQPPGYTFGHDMSAGDIDGDGDADIYSGKVLLLNDGSGRFESGTLLLPPEAKLTTTYVMTSAIGDLDGDHVEDIVVAYAEGGPAYAILSRWSGDTAGWQVMQLPVGLFGADNTKVNSGSIADINHDGIADIVFGETRATPYYEGRALQILIGNGDGTFRDETDGRIDNMVRDQRQGEGEVKIIDVDHDGDLDLFESCDTRFVNGRLLPGTSVALNDGTGNFTWVSDSAFSYVKPYQLSGTEAYEQFYLDDPLGRLFPVDLDGQAGIDYVGTVMTPLSTLPQIEPSVVTAFVATSTKPLGRGVDELLGGLLTSDDIAGFDGNDTITGAQGNDTIDGGPGRDIAIYIGARTDYTVTLGSMGATVTDNIPNRDGTDSLVNVERFQFRDGTVGIDIDAYENAGMAYRLYQAAFNRVPDTPGLGYWIRELDEGKGDLAWVANNFIISAEFQATYGAPATVSDTQFINLLYQNVLHRAPDASGLAYWQDELTRGFERARVLASFSESIENQQNVIGVIQDGIFFT